MSATATASQREAVREVVKLAALKVYARRMGAGKIAGVEAVRVALPHLHAGQMAVKDNAVRYNILCCGRRWGKDVLLIDRLVEPALAGYPVAWFSPTYKMLTEVWRTLRNLLVPVLLRVNTQEHRLELTTGGVIDMWSLDSPDGPRGRKYKRVIINEAAMIAQLQGAWQNIIRPTLMDLEGDAYFGSTPRGRNFFHKLFLMGNDPELTDYMAWQRPTNDNPYIAASEIEAAREAMPEEVYEQEILAIFLEGQGAVFRNIKANLTAPKNADPAVHMAHRVVMGVDWGQKKDFTALSVFCADCMQELEIDRFNQVAWSLQRARLMALGEKWGARHYEIEINSIGSPNFEALDEEGLPVFAFDTNSATKAPLIQSFALALEREEAQWLDDPVATGELEAYESRVSPHTGRTSYSAPEGGHDDSVIGRALAWHAVQEGGAGLSTEAQDIMFEWAG